MAARIFQEIDAAMVKSMHGQDLTSVTIFVILSSDARNEFMRAIVESVPPDRSGGLIMDRRYRDAIRAVTSEPTMPAVTVVVHQVER